MFEKENIHFINEVLLNFGTTGVYRVLKTKYNDKVYRVPMFGVTDVVIDLILDKLPSISFPGKEVEKCISPKGFEFALNNATFKEVKHLFYRESGENDAHDLVKRGYNEPEKIYVKNSYTIEDHMLDLLHMLDNFRYKSEAIRLSDEVKYCFRIVSKDSQDYYLLEGTYKEYNELRNHMRNVDKKHKKTLLHTKYDGAIYFNYYDIKYDFYISSIHILNQYMTNMHIEHYFEKLKDSIIKTICKGEFFIHGC